MNKIPVIEHNGLVPDTLIPVLEKECGFGALRTRCLLIPQTFWDSKFSGTVISQGETPVLNTSGKSQEGLWSRGQWMLKMTSGIFNIISHQGNRNQICKEIPFRTH